MLQWTYFVSLKFLSVYLSHCKPQGVLLYYSVKVLVLSNQTNNHLVCPSQCLKHNPRPT